MGYLHILNLFNPKAQDILHFKTVIALEKIHGTSGHVAWENGQIRIFSGGEKRERVIALFDLPQLTQKFLDKFGDQTDVIIFGELYGGCLAWRTPILLADGSTDCIGDIVNHKKQVEVLSYNLVTGELEAKKVIGWSRAPNKNNWVTLFLRKRGGRGGKPARIVATKNHVFYVKTNNQISEKRCENLQKGDVVYMSGERLSLYQEEIIRGGLLGDGSLYKNSFRFGHSDKQASYFKFKQRLLKSIYGNDESYVSGFGANCKKFISKSLPDIGNIRKELYKNNKKFITNSYLNKLTPLALAIWYMDDGTLKHFPKGFHRDQSQLCTDGFSENEVDLIVKWFNAQNIFCNKSKHKKYFRVTFTPEGTKKLHWIIAPYVCTSMKYKLTDRFRHISCILENEAIIEQSNRNLIETDIVNVKEGNPYTIPCYNERFDIEVEDNHNFFANGILVHNSQQGMRATYGDKLKFISFEVKIGDSWLSVPQAFDCATSLGFEFVDWVEIPTTCDHTLDLDQFETGEFKDPDGVIHRPDRLCYINHERDKPSTQAIRNGCGDDKLREGVVLHPPFECTKNNGERVLCKHKRDEFRETKTPRVVDPAKQQMLEGAQKIAAEYVTAIRLDHVLNRLISSRDKKDIGIEDTRDVISLMIEDVNREGSGEFEPSPAVNKSIGAATAKMFKAHLQNSIRS